MEIDDGHGTVYMERAFKKTKKQTPAIFGNTIEKKKKKSLHEAVFKNIRTLERLKTLQCLNLIR